MVPAWLRTWVRRNWVVLGARRHPRVARRSYAHCQPHFEFLEDRLVPSSVVVSGTPGSDTLLLRNNGGTVGYTLNGVTTPLPADTTSFTFNGGGGSDLMTVDYSGGALGLNITDDCTGDTGAILAVQGDGSTTTASYLPDSAVDGNGTITINGSQTITFLGLTPVDMSDMETATITLPNANNDVAIDQGVDFSTDTH